MIYISSDIENIASQVGISVSSIPEFWQGSVNNVINTIKSLHKDGGKDSKNKSIKDKEKDKQITKIKKSSLMELKESHENRLQLLLHIDDPKLTQRIASLMSILDDIIFVLTN